MAATLQQLALAGLATAAPVSVRQPTSESVAAITLCPAAAALTFKAVPTATEATPLELKTKPNTCLAISKGCAGHGCIVEGPCKGAPTWKTAVAPGGNGVLIQTFSSADDGQASTPICLDFNQGEMRAQAFNCGTSGAYVNQHWGIDAATRTIHTTMAKFGEQSLCMGAVPPPPPPPPPPAPAPPPAPPVSKEACSKYHPSGSDFTYDPSGPLLMPDGTWHIFPDSGGWSHCTTKDLLHYNCSHPKTGFDGDTGSVTVTPKGTFAMWPTVGKAPPGIEMATPATPDLDTWVHHGVIGVPPSAAGGLRDPGRALQLKSGWYVPAGVGAPASACPGPKSSAGCGGIHWFRADNDSMTHLNHTGFLYTSRTITEMECPDVFELGGKIVILTSTQGLNGWTQLWVGEMSQDDLTFKPDYSDRLDHGASGISTIYAAKTGTTAQPPFNRRILLGFGGWTESKVTKCGNVYLLPKELSMSSTGKLLQHPAKEMIGLRKTPAVAPALSAGSQIEVLVQCPIESVPKAGVLSVRTLLASGKDQSVVVGYNFTAGTGFAAISPSLSTRGARTDTASLPGLASTKILELRVFVDGHMVETFFGGDAVITSITGNTVPSASITSTLVNTAGLDGCNVSSWTLGL